MATMNISLPEALKRWAETRAESGRYGNVSDYMRDLIRRDQEREVARVELQELIAQGLSSGISDRSMDDVLREARARARVDDLPQEPEGR
jgi:antitoxin ParD1/3/4